MNELGMGQAGAVEAPEPEQEGRFGWRMADWEERLFYERNEIAVRTKRLELALRAGGLCLSDDDYRALLDRQLGLMQQLLQVLDERIARI